MNPVSLTRQTAAAALVLCLASGCETYKVVDETLAGFVAGEEYMPPDEAAALELDMAKQLEEAQKMAEEAAKKAEEMAKLAEEAKAAEEAAKVAEAAALEAAEAAEEDAKEQKEAMEMAEFRADIADALEDLKAEKQKQDEFDALIAALEAKEDATVAQYEAKEEQVIAEYEAKEAEIIAQYEEEAQQPTRVNVKVYAEENTNRNAEGEASPVSVRLVALTSEHQLMGTDYFALQDDMPGALGATFVQELSEVSAEPGQFVSTGELEVPRTTQKIGVIAGFADVDRAIWRDNIDVVDRGDEVNLLVALEESAVRIMREGEAPRLIVPALYTEPVPFDPLPIDPPPEAERTLPALNTDPFAPDIFDDEDLSPDTLDSVTEPLLVDEEGATEEAILPAEDELVPTPEPEIFYDVNAGNLVFLDGTTRMDSQSMLDLIDGEGSMNTTLLMRNPASVKEFDVLTLSPLVPVQDFWHTEPLLFTERPAT